jgi:dTDP-4-amino-4,6-dideoxygalactose transaminase
MIDLFRPFVAPGLPEAVAEVYRADAEGRVYIGEGPRVKRLQAELRTAFEAERPVRAVSSCTAAIDLSLQLLNLEPGDIVISTPMTCSATNTPAANRRLQIAWADVDPVTGLIDPDSVGRVLERVNTENKGIAVVAVDWAGRMADYNRLREITDRYGVAIIEDAAHSPLATHNGRYQTKVGGEYVCWSFGPIKHLCADNGGAIYCPTDQEADDARLLSWYGLDRESKADFRCEQDIEEAGYKYILSDVSAAALLANLPHLPDVIHAHRKHARHYDAALAELPPERITLPPPDPGCSYWLYSLLVDDRASFQAHMLDRGIATSQVHRRNDEHTAFRLIEHPASDARPGLDAFASKHCAIPVGHWLTEHDLGQIVDAVREWALR